MAEKETALGSIYINPTKDVGSDVKAQIAKCVEYLREHKAYLNISVKKEMIDNLETNKGYINLVGLTNGFKKSDTDSDFFVAAKKKLGGGASASASTTTSSGDSPFG